MCVCGGGELEGVTQLEYQIHQIQQIQLERNLNIYHSNHPLIDYVRKNGARFFFIRAFIWSNNSVLNIQMIDAR